MRVWAVLNDIQFPFHDKRVLDLVVRFVRSLKPDGVVLNGDIVDCYELSEFDKNPLQKAGLEREIALARTLMEDLAYIPEKWWIGGNHEDRLRRYLWHRATKLAPLGAVTFPALFGLEDFGFRWKPYGGVLKLGKLLVTHGSLVLKHSGWTGRAHFDKYGNSVLVGHTHRLGVYYRTNAKGVHAGYENGCLCRLDPEYVQYPDWQQGFSIVHVGEGGYFSVQQIPILRRREFFYGGVRYE